MPQKRSHAEKEDREQQMAGTHTVPGIKKFKVQYSTKTVPKRYQNGTKTVPKQSENSTETVPKQYLNGVYSTT